MDGFHPIRYVKAHPAGTVICLGLGYWLGCRYGGMIPLPFVSAKAKVSAGGDDD